jgi:hypothetical protein
MDERVVTQCSRAERYSSNSLLYHLWKLYTGLVWKDYPYTIMLSDASLSERVYDLHLSIRASSKAEGGYFQLNEAKPSC